MSLYSEYILDLNRYPKNKRVIKNSLSAKGDNPLCGDNIEVFVEMDGDILKDISFQGVGCAISQASAELMSRKLKGLNKDEALKIIDNFVKMLKMDKYDVELVKGFKIFEGIKKYPSRIKCATLAWHALIEAI